MVMWKTAVRLALLSALVTLIPATAQPPAGLESTPNLEAMTPANQALYYVMRRGANWLTAAQLPNGNFHQGFNVAINAPLDAAHFYHQVEAALTLAKVSRLTANPRYTTAAQQACLTLLSNTKTDPQDPQVRFTVFPEATVNRLGSAGLLLRAIHELAAPADVRLTEAECLANFLKTCQQADAALRSPASAIQQASFEPTWLYEGIALEGLTVSLNHRPSPPKLELLQKAASYYTAQVKQIPITAYPSFMTSFAEIYLRTKDPACAAAVCNMADALCNAQVQPEPGKIPWSGGFYFGNPKEMRDAPRADSARYVTALCDAYRVARAAGDAGRAEKYRQAAGLGVQFLASLQYTPSGVEHFAEAYQPRVLGAFRSAPGEGTIRLQDTAACTLAMATYLSDVAGVSLAPAQATPAAPVVPK
jgi:hypothetical protein